MEFQFFLKWDALHAILNSHWNYKELQGKEVYGVTGKRSTKRLKHAGNLFRKNLQLKSVC